MRRKKPNTSCKILHLDIETAPTNAYVWSLFPRYIAIGDITAPGYTLCWSAMWEGANELLFSSIEEDGEVAMIEKMWHLLDEADVVVHYNGTKFDIPTLNREMVRLEMPPPSAFAQIDLLKTVRKQFRFQSNKLDFVCQQLGLGAKTQHKGMALWYGCMDGDDKSWATMTKYNKQDVRLLGKLYRRLLPWIHNHPNLGMYVEDPEDPVCPNCGSQHSHRKGTQINTNTASYDRYSCVDCKTPFRSRLRAARTSPNVMQRT